MDSNNICTDKVAEPNKKKLRLINEIEEFELNLSAIPTSNIYNASVVCESGNKIFDQKASAGDMDTLHLIDEVIDNEASEDESEDSVYDSEVPEEEIDALLEEGLPEEMKGPRSQRKKLLDDLTAKDLPNCPYERREKVMLIGKKQNHFEVLPEGWVEVTHSSGMPIYLHRESRVCTFSRPYFLGSGSLRKHSVPVSAIPCLKYLKDREQSEKEKEESEKKNASSVNDNVNPTGTSKSTDILQNQDHKIDENNSLPPGPLALALAAVLPQNELIPKNGNLAIAETRVESVNEIEDAQSLDTEQLHAYCKRRFEFKSIKHLRFKSWRDKRRYHKFQKRNRPQLPDGTNLISLIKNNDDDSGGLKKEWVINPKGKSYVCLLHEYVQHVLKDQPKYEFKEVENAATPYSASISINGVVYSTGYGSSKKYAKLDAAKLALEILLPDLGKKIRSEKKTEEEENLSFFDEIRVEDHRVPDLCNKTSELSPFTILLNCLQRNFGMSKTSIDCHLITKKNQNNEFVMTVGKHTVQVNCRNKKDGKQRASQAILQKLHPQITNWGSFLRLYGNRSLQVMHKRKAEEQEVTLLQTNATMHQPNLSIINKLKEEMLKLRHMKDTIEPIGRFMPPDDVSLPSIYGTDLNNIDL